MTPQEMGDGDPGPEEHEQVQSQESRPLALISAHRSDVGNTAIPSEPGNLVADPGAQAALDSLQRQDKARARGAIALKAALDAEYRMERDEDGMIRLSATKIKDADFPEPLAFKLRSVELGIEDENGQPVTSAALFAVEYVEPVKLGKTGRGKNQTQALNILKELYLSVMDRSEPKFNDQSEARVLTGSWRNECIKSGIDRRRIGQIP